LLAAALLLIGVRLLHLPFPVLIASLVLFARMSGPAQQLQSNALQIAVYAPAFAAIRRRLGDLERAVAEPPRAEALDWQQLVLDSVTFEHRPGFGVRRVSLTLRRGEWLAVSGASGGGKTTLVDLVAGLLAPAEGRITIDGRGMAELLERWRRAIAYVGQEGNVFNDSVRGNLLAEGGASDEQGLWQALELVGLAEVSGRRVGAMSKGMQQRLGIAQAMIGAPRLLLLDEPTSALDPAGRRTVRELLETLRSRGVAVLLNSHLLSEVELVCDRVAIIARGEVVAAGTPAELSHAGGVEVETARGVRQFAQATREEVPRIVRELVEAGEEIYGVRVVRSSLEDVYLEVVGGR